MSKEILDSRELALAMLEWEQKRAELDELEAAIKATVLELGTTQTVGNVRASYNSGRKTYDYESAARECVDEDVIAEYTDIVTVKKTDWRKLCLEAKIDAPYKEGTPSVSLKLL